MKQGLFTVTENVALTKNVYRMRLSGDTSEITVSGQFVNILLDGFYLRRPISVCDRENGLLTIVYKVVGKGTEKMSEMKTGEVLDVLTGLGNGYDLSDAGDAPLLIGGGVGVPPMYLLAKDLLAQGKQVSVILGFNTKDKVSLIPEQRGRTIAVSLSGLSRYKTEELMGSDKVISFEITEVVPRMNFVLGCTFVHSGVFVFLLIYFIYTRRFPP